MLLQQLAGLQQVQRELRQEPERHKDIKFYATAILKFVVERVVEGLWNENIGRLLLIVQNALNVKSPDKAASPPAVADIFGELQNIALDVVKKMLGVDDLDIGKPRLPAVDSFVETQQAMLTASGMKIQTRYVGETKPKMRMAPRDPDPKDPNPRVTYARSVLTGVQNATATAAKEQYDASAVSWALAEAQATLGRHTDDDGNLATSMDKDKTSMGMFIIEVDAGSPRNKQPRVKQVRVEGLTETIRKHLEDSDRPLALLGARRIVASATDPGTEVRVSKNESGELFVNSTDEDATRWLTEHGATEQPPLDTPKGGALTLFEEIEKGPQGTLKKAGGLRL
jgi:hypothetical protein